MRIVLTHEAGFDRDSKTLPDGARVEHLALTSTRYREVGEVQRELRSQPAYGAFRALVITSARSRDYVTLARDALAPDGRVFSVGPATTEMLAGQGVVVDGQAATRALDLVDLIAAGPVLLIGAAVMRDELPRALKERDIDVVHQIVYRTLPVELSRAAADSLRSADVVVIGAPSAWSVARAHVVDSAWVVVPGPTTAQSVRVDHQRVIVGGDRSLRSIVAPLDL
jgi:uroporphyrinogen-III synthase